MPSSATLATLRKHAVDADGNPRPLIVTKQNWSKGYCVFIRENENGRFNGHSFKNGKLCSREVHFEETETGFYEYKGPDRDSIILFEKEEIKLPPISPSEPSARKEFWPTHGKATDIKEREGKNHKEDGDPTIH